MTILRFGARPRSLAATVVAIACLAAAACADLSTEPEETGAARIDFVTYPGEVEPGNVAIFTMVGIVPSPCHELTGAVADLDDGRVELSASWRRTDGDPCTGVVESYETTATLEVPAGLDSLAVTVADSVWDRIEVRVDAPGFKKGAGELTGVGEVEGAPGCFRGRTAADSRSVLLDAEVTASRAFLVGRLESRIPEACAGAGLANVLGTLTPESVGSTATFPAPGPHALSDPVPTGTLRGSSVPTGSGP